MASSVLVVCRSMGMICDFVSLFNATSNALESTGDERGIRVASAVNTTAMLVLQAAELVVSNKSNNMDTLRKLKTSEFFLRVLHIGIKWNEAR